MEPNENGQGHGIVEAELQGSGVNLPSAGPGCGLGATCSREHPNGIDGPREAVVIVHGIGEQRRYDTLRSFVGLGRKSEDSGILGPRPTNPISTTLAIDSIQPGGAQIGPSSNGTPGKNAPNGANSAGATSGIASRDDRVYAGPSPLGDKRLKIYTIEWDGNPTHKTDVFELYWAPHYRNTTFSSVVKWAFMLASRSRNSVSTERLLGGGGRIPVVLPWLMIALLWAMVVLAVAAASVNWPVYNIAVGSTIGSVVIAVGGCIAGMKDFPVTRSVSKALAVILAVVCLIHWSALALDELAVPVESLVFMRSALLIAVLAAGAVLWDSGKRGIQAMIRCTILGSSQMRV